MNISDLKNALELINKLVEVSDFNCGATSEEISTLQLYFQNELKLELPSILIDLYSWHNGQLALDVFGSEFKWNFMSIKAAIKQKSYFIDDKNEFQRPFNKEWFPIFANALGDYLIFDSISQKIISYYHDDESRLLVYNNLIEMINEIIKSLVSIQTIKNKVYLEIMGNNKPTNVILEVFLKKPSNNLVLAKDIRILTGDSLKTISQGLKSGMSASIISRDLSQSMNSLEQAKDIKLVSKLINLLSKNHLEPVVYLKLPNKNDRTIVDLDFLEILETKCTSF